MESNESSKAWLASVRPFDELRAVPFTLSSSKHSLLCSTECGDEPTGASAFEAGVNPVIVDEPIIHESARRRKR
jgi:hypothetical protein